MKIEIIPTKGWLYDKCENMEQLYDKYYYPLLVENKELKKQLKGTTHCYDEVEHRQLKNQQQEFIKYLEDEIEKTCNSKNMSKCNLYQEILQKYKEIIGEK